MSFVPKGGYPGLKSNPGHELAKRQMTNGYGGVISFGLETDDKTVERFYAALKVVTFAVSLGHDESLIFPQPSYTLKCNGRRIIILLYDISLTVFYKKLGYIE